MLTPFTTHFKSIFIQHIEKLKGGAGWESLFFPQTAPSWSWWQYRPFMKRLRIENITATCCFFSWTNAVAAATSGHICADNSSWMLLLLRRKVSKRSVWSGEQWQPLHTHSTSAVRQTLPLPGPLHWSYTCKSEKHKIRTSNTPTHPTQGYLTHTHLYASRHTHISTHTVIRVNISDNTSTWRRHVLRFIGLYVCVETRKWLDLVCTLGFEPCTAEKTHHFLSWCFISGCL